MLCFIGSHLVKNEKLFSYGTLQYESVQLEKFSRVLEGRSDILSGFKLSTVKIEDPEVIAASGKDVHPIICYTGQSSDNVTGMIFEISSDELKQADAYEVSDYKRINVQLVSGVFAWVYVDAAMEILPQEGQ